MQYGHHGRDLLLELKRAGPDSIPAYNDTLVSAAIQDLQLHVKALNDQVRAQQQQQQQQQSRQERRSSATIDEGMEDNHQTMMNPPPQKPSMAVRPSLLLQNAAIERNKRCLLSYHWNRMQRIQQQYWNNNDDDYNNSNSMNHGKSSSSSYSNDDNTLCPAEHDYLHNYRKLIQSYTTTVLPWCTDVRAYALPPQSDRVQVRVVVDNNDSNDNHNSSASCLFDDGPIVLESGATVVFMKGSIHHLLWTDVEEYIRTGLLQIVDGEES